MEIFDQIIGPFFFSFWGEGICRHFGGFLLFLVLTVLHSMDAAEVGEMPFIPGFFRYQKIITSQLFLLCGFCSSYLICFQQVDK